MDGQKTVHYLDLPGFPVDHAHLDFFIFFETRPRRIWFPVQGLWKGGELYYQHNKSHTRRGASTRGIFLSRDTQRSITDAASRVETGGRVTMVNVFGGILCFFVSPSLLSKGWDGWARWQGGYTDFLVARPEARRDRARDVCWTGLCPDARAGGTPSGEGKRWMGHWVFGYSHAVLVEG